VNASTIGRSYPNLHDRLFLFVRRHRRIYRLWRGYLAIAVFLKRRVVGRIECLFRGHADVVTFRFPAQPTSRVCDRCGKRWRI